MYRLWSALVGRILSFLATKNLGGLSRVDRVAEFSSRDAGAKAQQAKGSAILCHF